MRAFIDWLLAQRYRLILLAVAAAPFAFFAPLSGALLALETVRRGVAQGLVSAAIALGGVIVLAIVTGSSPAFLGTLGASSFLAGVLVGMLLLRAGGSLALTFQWIVLIAAGGVLLISIGGGDSRTMFEPAVNEVIELLRESGAADDQLELLREWQHLILGLLAAVIFAQLVIVLLLAHWWSAIADREARFGTEFREFRLVRATGLAAALIVALSLVLDVALVQNLTPLALFAFLFQGLAVLHAWAHARQWHPVAVAPVYVLLVTPLMGAVVLAMSSIGLVDNFIDLRAPLRSGT
jgi:hypothetical protein